jgi:hypothetical protein
MPASLPISPHSPGVYFDRGFDGHAGEMQRTNDALHGMVSRNLPSPYDRNKAVSVLRDLNDDPRDGGHPSGLVSDRDKHRLVTAITDGISRSGTGNPVGISEDQAVTYGLGEGDVQTHQALRDSNLLNSALGYPNVPNVQALREGTVLGQGKLLDSPADNLDISANYWHSGEADPTHWANSAESYYPQNAWIGNQGSLQNVTENNGGSGWGNALAWIGRWENGGNRAIREPSEWSGPVVDAAKLASGSWQGAQDEKDHQAIKGYINRPSPLLPKGLVPGSPEADSHLTQLAALRDATKKPESQDYAASQGRELSTAGKAFADNKLFWADPFTAASGGVGMLRGVIGKGGMAAAKAAAGVAKAEAVSEGMSPFNYAGFLGSLIEDPKSSMTPSKYRENSDKAHAAFADAPEVLQRYGR